MNSASSRRAVVIGAGLGGLAVALRLAHRGWRVTVCERHDVVGGKMNRWSAAGFTFDTGPSLVTMPFVFEELFADAGEKLSLPQAVRKKAPAAPPAKGKGKAKPPARSRRG